MSHVGAPTDPPNLWVVLWTSNKGDILSLKQQCDGSMAGSKERRLTARDQNPDGCVVSLDAI